MGAPRKAVAGDDEPEPGPDVAGLRIAPADHQDGGEVEGDQGRLEDDPGVEEGIPHSAVEPLGAGEIAHLLQDPPLDPQGAQPDGRRRGLPVKGPGALELGPPSRLHGEVDLVVLPVDLGELEEGAAEPGIVPGGLIEAAGLEEVPGGPLEVGIAAAEPAGQEVDVTPESGCNPGIDRPQESGDDAPRFPRLPGGPHGERGDPHGLPALCPGELPGPLDQKTGRKRGREPGGRAPAARGDRPPPAERPRPPRPGEGERRVWPPPSPALPPQRGSAARARARRLRGPRPRSPGRLRASVEEARSAGPGGRDPRAGRRGGAPEVSTGEAPGCYGGRGCLRTAREP